MYGAPFFQKLPKVVKFSLINSLCLLLACSYLFVHLCARSIMELAYKDRLLTLYNRCKIVYVWIIYNVITTYKTIIELRFTYMQITWLARAISIYCKIFLRLFCQKLHNYKKEVKNYHEIVNLDAKMQYN